MLLDGKFFLAGTMLGRVLGVAFPGVMLIERYANLGTYQTLVRAELMMEERYLFFDTQEAAQHYRSQRAEVRAAL